MSSVVFNPFTGTLDFTRKNNDTISSVTGTPNRITVTAGTNPVIDIAATYVGQTSITTLGTITTGVWNGTAISPTSGGTGFSTYTTGDILYASAANTLSKLPIGTANKVLTIVGGIPSWQTPAIGVSAWQTISANQTLAVNNGYICIAPGGALSLALPAVSAVGDIIAVVLDGATSWTITQPNAATQIRVAANQTTLGVGGSLASTSVGDTVYLICETANARWVVPNFIGNITIV